ncbi:MoaD/ThiS family protein [Aquimarina sp. U1-2]|uniref:MoaD/ThiS family protein n=1 Tax=Aquimarina sp. U1-2 TaxID=2823141 RepID=UPI001AECB743|nr:MoaD/ThiS family protein [Aquimarina sp. U1-2]MBP2833791.1 MoaD/ThiS family protein [Aquimarina sp. U1-2]
MTEITLTYYGEVAEKTGKEQETVQLENIEIPEIMKYLESTYALNTKGIKIAVNHELATQDTQLKANDEIAILSPFAGG